MVGLLMLINKGVVIDTGIYVACTENTAKQSLKKMPGMKCLGIEFTESDTARIR